MYICSCMYIYNPLYHPPIVVSFDRHFHLLLWRCVLTINYSPQVTNSLLFQMKRHMTCNDQPGPYLNPFPYQDKAVIELLVTFLYEERDSKLQYKKKRQTK